MFQSRIYIAEGDKCLQQYLSAALKVRGFEVEVFGNGYGLVELMDNWPAVFLIDIELPGINGIEVCKWLKSHQDSRNIPVILIAGEPYLKILAASAQPDDYVEKPVSIEKVITVISKFLPVAGRIHAASSNPRKTPPSAA